MSERLDRLLSHMNGSNRRSSEASNSTFPLPPTDTTPLLSSNRSDSSNNRPTTSCNIESSRNALDTISQPQQPQPVLYETPNHHQNHQQIQSPSTSVIQRKKRSQHYHTDSVKSILSSRSFDNFATYESIISDDSDSSSGLDDDPGQTSWIVAAFLLINASLGAGLLNYPVAYNRLGGIYTATVIQFFALILMATTMLTLVYCARLHNQNSYHGVMKTMCGKFVMQASAASIAVTCFGICVTFNIIVGDQFDRLFATYIGDDFCSHWFANRYFTIATVTIFTMWPMCYFRRLDFLKHINLLGVLASFYVIFLYIYNYYQRKSTVALKPIYKTWPDSSIEFIASLPVVFFAYQTHEIVIPVHVAMKDKSMKAFTKTTILSLIILFFLYCGAGTYGYLSYGQDVAADIMLMYDAHDPLVVAGIIALIIKMVTTYPPVVFCGRDTIIRLVMSRHRKNLRRQLNNDQSNSSSDTSANRNSPLAHSAQRLIEEANNQPLEQNRKYKFWHLSITTVWNIAVLVLSLIIPNITIAIGFLGSLASANVFIFPGLALIGLARQFRAVRKRSEERNGANSERANLNSSQGSGKSFWKNVCLENSWVQSFLTFYGGFIVAMGVLMCVIILWQMTRDLSNPTLSHELCNTTISFN